MPRFCSFSPLKWHCMHPILKASRKILTFKYYDKFVFFQIRDSMGAHLIFFIIFTLFSCIILTNQSLPWYSLRSGFQCDTKMAAVFSCMRPPQMWEHVNLILGATQRFISKLWPLYLSISGLFISRSSTL